MSSFCQDKNITLKAKLKNHHQFYYGIVDTQPRLKFKISCFAIDVVAEEFLHFDDQLEM
jgi:hypothetical protein